ncbi:MAG: sigma-70 family RNA polymerase sigma factor [Candidatus Izimaplasma sp.]|nr:sigma-70 family RNA polymerase sigma factor [Candidatus Izimaplasma bacterium]
MDYYKHNDFEILYQIKEGNQDALKLMFEKYSPLISKKINRYNLKDHYEDMMQEGRLTIYNAVYAFDSSYGRSFRNYLSEHLNYTYLNYLSKKIRRQDIFDEHVDYIYEFNQTKQTNEGYYQFLKKEMEKILTKREYIVYTLREVQNYSVDYVSEHYYLPKKTIYNTLYRAKQKLHKHFNN